MKCYISNVVLIATQIGAFKNTAICFQIILEEGVAGASECCGDKTGVDCFVPDCFFSCYGRVNCGGGNTISSNVHSEPRIFYFGY